MAKANPFIPPGKDYGAVDTESRLRALEDFNLEQCHAALEVLGLQATVEKKLRIRIRALEKLATSDKSPAIAQPSTALELDYTHMSRRMIEELAKRGKCLVATADLELLTQERDAAQARIAELEKQKPVGVMRASREPGVAPYADIWPWLEPGVQLYAAPVAEAGQVPEGWRVMRCTSSIQREGDQWEIYDPQGSGGVVSVHDVKDWAVRGLLDALAAAPQPAKGE